MRWAIFGVLACSPPSVIAPGSTRMVVVPQVVGVSWPVQRIASPSETTSANPPSPAAGPSAPGALVVTGSDQNPPVIGALPETVKRVDRLSVTAKSARAGLNGICTRPSIASYEAGPGWNVIATVAPNALSEPLSA